MQVPVNPEDSPPDIYVTWSNPRMPDSENLPRLSIDLDAK